MAAKGKPNQQQISVELGEKEAEGVYSNLAIISHSPAEFIIDFARMLPGIPKAKVGSRIIMTPQHTKMLFRALGENLSKFENTYGEIDIDGTAQVDPFHGFPSSGSNKIN